MTTTLSVKETDTLLQRVDGYNLSGEINRQPLKTLDAPKVALLKK